MLTCAASIELTHPGKLIGMGRVIDGSASDGKLSRRAFVALKRMPAGAKLFKPAFSDAVEARDVLADLCHGRS